MRHKQNRVEAASPRHSRLRSCVRPQDRSGRGPTAPRVTICEGRQEGGAQCGVGRRGDETEQRRMLSFIYLASHAEQMPLEPYSESA